MEMKIYSGRNSCKLTCKQRTQEEPNHLHQGRAQPGKAKHQDKDKHRHRDNNSKEGPGICRS